MSTALMTIDRNADYAIKEAGPIIWLVLWGVSVAVILAAALYICRTTGIHSLDFNWVSGKVAIVCN